MRRHGLGSQLPRRSFRPCSRVTNSQPRQTAGGAQHRQPQQDRSLSGPGPRSPDPPPTGAIPSSPLTADAGPCGHQRAGSRASYTATPARNSSSAKNTAASGVQNSPAKPAATPATSRRRRSCCLCRAGVRKAGPRRRDLDSHPFTAHAGPQQVAQPGSPYRQRHQQQGHVPPGGLLPHQRPGPCPAALLAPAGRMPARSPRRLRAAAPAARAALPASAVTASTPRPNTAVSTPAIPPAATASTTSSASCLAPFQPAADHRAHTILHFSHSFYLSRACAGHSIRRISHYVLRGKTGKPLHAKKTASSC